MVQFSAVAWIHIGIRMFLDLLDPSPDPLVEDTDPDHQAKQKGKPLVPSPTVL